MLRVVCGSNLFPDVISRGGEENPAAVRESGSFHSSIQSHLKGHSMAAKEKTRVPVRLELLQPALLQIPYDRSHNRRLSTAQALFKPFHVGRIFRLPCRQPARHKGTLVKLSFGLGAKNGSVGPLQRGCQCRAEEISPQLAKNCCFYRLHNI